MKRSTAFVDAGMMALATVLGVGSVALFAASASGIFKGARMPWTESTLLLWDAALSLAFFVQHSGMVRRQFRAHLAGHLPERYQGVLYSIASGMVLTLVALLWQHSDNYLLHLQGIPLWIARGCTGLALAILVWSAIALRSFDLLGLVPVRAHLRGRHYRAFPFTVRGPYRWVRHPIYFSVILLFWSTPVLTTDRLLFNVLWTAWIIVGTMLEERDLAREFGDAYRDYRQKVPMLIPLHGPLIHDYVQESRMRMKRQDHEQPAAVTERGWRYHHLGIPTTMPRPGERHLPHLKVYVSGFDTSPYGIEWMRFEPGCPISELVRTVPHIAFEVDDLDAALVGQTLLGEVSSPSDGVRVAMILDNGAPVELLEFAGLRPEARLPR